jgi:hypothetical protein
MSVTKVSLTSFSGPIFLKPYRLAPGIKVTETPERTKFKLDGSCWGAPKIYGKFIRDAGPSLHCSHGTDESKIDAGVHASSSATQTPLVAQRQD